MAARFSIAFTCVASGQSPIDVKVDGGRNRKPFVQRVSSLNEDLRARTFCDIGCGSHSASSGLCRDGRARLFGLENMARSAQHGLSDMLWMPQATWVQLAGREEFEGTRKPTM